MNLKSTNRAQPLFALFLVPFILMTSAPSPAVEAGGSRASFSGLSDRAQRLDTAVLAKENRRTGKRPLSANAVRIKDAAKNDAEAKQAPPKKGREAGAAQADLPNEPLAEDAARIKVGSSGEFRAELSSGRRVTFSPKQVPAVGYSKNRYFLVEGDNTLAVSPAPIRFIPVGSGTVLNLPDFVDMNWNNTVNLNVFRGVMEIVYSEKSQKLWAVNELYVEDYLRGIAEARHSSPEEHLKVMAIVSRSYVVNHLASGGRHAGEPFHLKNSRHDNGDDQVYRGYLAEVRQPRIARAVADTAGKVVTYQGKPVITPYSTRPSGRTLSPAEAGWKVDWPWVVSVPDPDTAGMTKLGHGVGLSGVGSRMRAERGETAAQILDYYFRGTALGKAGTDGQLVRVSIFGR